MTFEQALAVVLKFEGGWTTNAADPGNWTGGRCGAGTLGGTKWGLSAAAYPTLDLCALTPAEAAVIYRRDYWDTVGGEQLPGPLRLIMFDAAVNSGVSRSVRWLQLALGVAADGVIGPGTLAALERQAGRGADLCVELLAQRIVFDASLPTWRVFGLGWARRLAALPFQTLSAGA